MSLKIACALVDTNSYLLNCERKLDLKPFLKQTSTEYTKGKVSC